ncbi:PH domain-containing protein [Saccharopolyspora rhizosphaerae]|uniref:PH domain-containing protein n=1 Tax=Saccharopolyspora rhizosphaerae TaxID=2492662 RepID=A0A426JKZ7_9PSEU|nr:PH domain-containing protein [Saccharopolyspora rhizosphaerae]RRO13760.1 PH domain-containing protein [Saccharopolyspora rhizosphaerae]
MDAKRWAPPVALVGCGWALTAAAATWALLAERPTDRVFVGVLALALLAASAFGTLCRPRLQADTSGVTVRALTGPRHYGWDELTIRVRETRRLGLTATSLELDANPELTVLTRLDLGEDPYTTADALHALRR